jgi:hypothetical protein
VNDATLTERGNLKKDIIIFFTILKYFLAQHDRKFIENVGELLLNKVANEIHFGQKLLFHVSYMNIACLSPNKLKPS